jgi:hypothetical protein
LLSNKKQFTGRLEMKKSDKSTWAIGGGLLMGIGVGFFSYTHLL